MRLPVNTFVICVVALAIVASVVTEIGCQPPDKRYLLRGQVVKKNAANQITVKNEDIPGFMSPMTMRYNVRGSGAPQELQVGDTISAEVVVARDGRSFWLENIRIMNSSGQKR
jgi:Cu/Ag efflux protein CusF